MQEVEAAHAGGGGQGFGGWMLRNEFFESIDGISCFMKLSMDYFWTHLNITQTVPSTSELGQVTVSLTAALLPMSRYRMSRNLVDLYVAVYLVHEDGGSPQPDGSTDEEQRTAE